jgi:hypothetical protein
MTVKSHSFLARYNHVSLLQGHSPYTCGLGSAFRSRRHRRLPRLDTSVRSTAARNDRMGMLTTALGPALTRRRPINWVLMWHCAEQVIVTASANDAPTTPGYSKLFASVGYRR